ncbi:unnamed protein product [marine sediment metagenome]|uniref:Uncharacterized protein n=1 Tax=marine sediment metagenome TaxID=412755 RepID=X0UJP0_9ZZZZ
MVLSMALSKMDNSLRSHGTKAYFRNFKPEAMSEKTWGRVLLRVRTIQSTWIAPKNFAVECGMTPEQAEKWMAIPARVPLRLHD